MEFLRLFREKARNGVSRRCPYGNSWVFFTPWRHFLRPSFLIPESLNGPLNFLNLAEELKFEVFITFSR
jgi:hypothetical protein